MPLALGGPRVRWRSGEVGFRRLWVYGESRVCTLEDGLMANSMSAVFQTSDDFMATSGEMKDVENRLARTR
jgi:hypothetical protein